MTRRTVVGMALLVLTACSAEPEGASTSLGATSTSTSTTSTTVVPTTTTTTLPATTTLPPTTTTTLLEGNWADVPLVISGWALGWWDGAQWVQVDESTELPIRGGEDYQVAYSELTARLSPGDSRPTTALRSPCRASPWTTQNP